MAGKFPDREDFEIPSLLIDEHEWLADSFIDGETGTDCTLVYPPSDTECPNCLFDPQTGESANIYKDGGPMPFTDHTTCPWCNGFGRGQTPVEESIRMRVYYGGMEVNAAMRQFNMATQLAQDPDGLVFVIGYMNDRPSFERCDSIVIHDTKMSRKSKALPWGFRKNRYFAAMLKING